MDRFRKIIGISLAMVLISPIAFAADTSMAEVVRGLDTV